MKLIKNLAPCTLVLQSLVAAVEDDVAQENLVDEIYDQVVENLSFEEAVDEVTWPDNEVVVDAHFESKAELEPAPLEIDEDGMAKIPDDREPEWESVYVPESCPYKTAIGDTIGVHYYGALAATGKEFGASYRQGDAGIFEFKLEEKAIIRGWLQPLLEMCPGEKRHIEIPSDWGYGDKEAPGIPAESDLITDVEIIYIISAEDGQKYQKEARQLEVDPTYIPPGCEYYAQEGDLLFMEYHGTLESNGKVFDSSYHRGGTFDYEIGHGQAIKGWEMGMLGICAGERRHLVIPSDYAYGNSGTGSGSIPPGDSLVQDVKCVKIMTTDGKIYEALPETTIDDQESLYTPQKCVRKPQYGDRVWVAYDGRLQNTPEIIFDTSLKFMYGRVHPFVFTIGANQAIEGFETLIKSLCLGEKAHAVIPPSLAYGRRGDGGIIPPDARLDYIVEIVRIDDEDEKSHYAEADHVVLEKPEKCEKFVEANDFIHVQWNGYFQVTFESFQASDHNQDEVIRLGNNELFPALEKNLLGMCIGEKRQVVVPQEEAFGAEGMESLKIPPYTTLVYDIELNNIIKPSEHSEL